MKITKTILAGSLLVLLSTQRLPAPIQEETPSPSPTTTIENKPAPQPSAPTGPTRYTGTWTGKINMEKMGDVDVTLIINGVGTSVEISSKLSSGRHPVNSDGKKISWQSGPKHNIDWTLTMNADGQSAAATRTSAGVTTSATFQRVSAASGPNTTPAHGGRKGKRR